MKSGQLHVKVDESTLQIIKELRQSHSINVSELIRHSLRDKHASLTAMAASGAPAAPFPSDSPQAAV
jgi:hypothetical protein